MMFSLSFDISSLRYVLVTSFSPLRIYLYRRGLCRFSSERFDHLSIKNGKCSTHEIFGEKTHPLLGHEYFICDLGNLVSRLNVWISKPQPL